MSWPNSASIAFLSPSGKIRRQERIRFRELVIQYRLDKVRGSELRRCEYWLDAADAEHI